MSQAWPSLPYHYKKMFSKVMCLAIAMLLTSCVEGSDFPKFELNKIFQNTQGTQQNSKKVSNKLERESPSSLNGVVRTESLLGAQGNWNLVEQGGAMDPTQAHMLARKKVNVRRRKNMKELSAHFQPNAKSGEDGKMRVLRLEPDNNKRGSDLADFDLAESSVVKPTHTVAENDLLQKIKRLFGEKDTSSQSLSTAVVKPKEKPVVNQVKEGVEQRKTSLAGVILPPPLPSRKVIRVAKNARQEPVNTYHPDLSKLYIISKSGMVMPGYKPGALRKAKRVNKEKKVKLVRKASPVHVLNSAQRSGNIDEVSRAIKVRSGKHDNKTRLVIEVTKTTKYKVAIDHVRNVLRVKLDKTRWDLNPQDSFRKSSLLGGYVAREQSDSSVLFEVRLKRKTKILDTMILRPNLSSKHRVVIDLKD